MKQQAKAHTLVLSGLNSVLISLLDLDTMQNMHKSKLKHFEISNK